jgi:very-short-patch-repair endonuclease
MPASHQKPSVPLPMKQRSRALRKNQTDAEKAIWRLLCHRQMHGLKFRRQHVINNCILDFYCYAAKLAVELDGGQHSELAQLAYDAERSSMLVEQGVRVLRFSNNEVLTNPQSVLQAIAEALFARCQ